MTFEELVKKHAELNKKWILISNDNPIELKHTGLGIRFLEIDFAVLSIKNNEWAKSKQHFYTAATLDLIATTNFNSNQLSYGLALLSYPLLSDNNHIIERYAKIRYQPWGKMKGMDENDLLGKSDIWCNTIQFLMVNDLEGINRNLNILETITLPKLSKKENLLKDDYEFFKAIYSKDKAKMEEVLDKLVSSKIHKKRNINDIHAQYISLPALGYAKLAWRHGIEVEVNSPLIPKELLPIKPLEKYEIAYDFLKYYL